MIRGALRMRNDNLYIWLAEIRGWTEFDGVVIGRSKSWSVEACTSA
jgi:hypothetical protein